MVIVLQQFLLSSRPSVYYQYVVNKLLPILIQQYPQHQFYFLHKQPPTNWHTAYNVKFIKVPRLYYNTPLWHLWYSLKLPKLLKKVKADVYISIGGAGISTGVVPQLLMLADEGTNVGAYSKSETARQKKHIAKTLKASKAVITFSTFLKDRLNEAYAAGDEKIKVLYPVPAKAMLLNYMEQIEVKEKHTDDKEYFIYTGNVNSVNTIMLLKAFTIFKKRQKTAMKLVIINSSQPNAEFEQQLKNYKLRSDVVYMENVDAHTQTTLLSAAYAFVNVDATDADITLLEAVMCGLPVITPPYNILYELAPDSILAVEKENIADLADKMMLVYKDEALKSKMVEASTLFNQKHDVMQAAANFYKAIEETAK